MLLRFKRAPGQVRVQFSRLGEAEEQKYRTEGLRRRVEEQQRVIRQLSREIQKIRNPVTPASSSASCMTSSSKAIH
jgi:hypothetical protein